MTGVVTVESLDFTGSLFRPEGWRFTLKGGLEQFTLRTDFLPGPLIVGTGDLEMTPEKLALINAESTLLDASGRVSGALWGYLKGPVRADCTLDGNIGPKAAKWMYERAPVPAEYRIRPPVQVSGAHLIMAIDRELGFFRRCWLCFMGRRFPIQLAATPGGMEISKLVLTGENSRASLSLTLKQGDLKFSYAGRVTGTALDQLLLDNRILKGMIDGDFTVRTVSRSAPAV